MINIQDTKGHRYQINENHSLGSGGEGTIYPISGSNGSGLVAKLYFKASDALSQTKIDELSPLDGNLFVKPQIAVSGDYNGYIMEELNLSDYYPIYSLYSPMFANKRGLPSDYKRKLAEKLIMGVKNAHDNGIVIGDLNPFNIMVNDRLDLKFIDVDSYQTKSYKHNDKLLEEVRDFYFNGTVSENSDYFALSVMIFNLFTGMHPYKGIHKVYRDKLKDREINNISLLNEKEFSNIKVPKFYTPISDKALKDMFYEIYQLNKRFLIDMNGKHVDTVKFSAIVMSNELLIKELFSGNVKNVISSNRYIAVITDTEKRLYSADGKGIIMNYGVVDKSENLILTDKNIYSLRYGHLRHYNTSSKQFEEIASLQLTNVHCAKQYENILIVITKDDKMYTVYLDEIYANNVKYTVTNVYHKSFIKIGGLHEVLGKNSVIFYNSNNKLSSYIINEKIVDVIQNQNTGIYTVNNKNKVKHYLFTINKYGDMKVKEIDDVYPYSSNDKFIILYNDDKLHFLDKETLNEVVSFETTGLDNYNISFTNGGIIVYNHSKVSVLNTK